MEGMTLDFSKLKCKTHPLEPLTNFCLNPNCKTALCSQCICQHTDQHMETNTQPIYKPLREVHQANQDKIRTYVKVLEADKDRIMGVMKGIAERRGEFRGVLYEAKRDVMKIVDKVFEELELKIQEQIKQEQKKTGLHSIFQIESLCKKINREIDTLVNESQALNSFRFIDVIKNIETGTFGEIKKIHKQVMKEIKENQEFVPKLEFRKENLAQLELSTRRLISLSFYYPKTDPQQQQDNLADKQNQSRVSSSEMGKTLMKIVPISFTPTQSVRESFALDKSKVIELPKPERCSSVSHRNSASAMTLNIVPQFLDTNSFPFQYEKRTSGISDFRLTGSRVFVINRR